MPDKTDTFHDMSARSREVFRRIVESYIESGEPVGSRTLTRSLTEKVSAATIRNVMQDLEHLGLLDSPHTSSGRIPTQSGLRLFVDSLLEIGDLSGDERRRIESGMQSNQGDMAQVLDRAGSVLSGLSHGAGLVLAPKSEAPIKHIEFVSLAPDRALVVLVTADGQVENRVFTPPIGQTQSAMREAANFLNTIAEGKTLSEIGRAVAEEIRKNRRELDILAQQLVQAGVAVWENEGERHERLIVRGQSNLLDDNANVLDIERVRILFDELERKRDLAQFLELADEGEGVRVFIGSENKLFSLSGSSLVVSPYMNADRKIIGAVGVIGPTRLNYGRIVPIVNYTAQLVGRMLSGQS
ncbi:MAG: heat-inducible transcriptional repressor HrcA [Rhodobacteraceae bacterium]|nr:heat-inducible transcriptional repressor HrcA [Paracoccaceae bacterium]MCB1368554.1 heat-inducible transcriptional repressor HrcA [Paracoccaceae bacterium]